MGYYGWGRWAPYVTVAERKRKAAKKVAQLCKQGKIVDPITIEGRTITRTYWGSSWCKNLESYSDFANRLPRGRTYVRNGSVIDLKIEAGSVSALVSGSDIYKVSMDIAALAKDKWQAIVKECSGKIDSLIELLKGKFSKGVMEVIARKERGLFPHPEEIKMSCSCPDYADVCKHIAAVFYGIGARFDVNPELLFILRQVDHNDLIVADGAVETLIKRDGEQFKERIASDELSSLFGIDIDVGATKDADSTKKLLFGTRMTKSNSGMEKSIRPHKVSKAKNTEKTRKQQKIQKEGKARRTRKTKKEKKRKKTEKSVKLTKMLSKSKAQKRTKIVKAKRKKDKIS